jgi:hypothetical protein
MLNELKQSPCDTRNQSEAHGQYLRVSSGVRITDTMTGPLWRMVSKQAYSLVNSQCYWLWHMTTHLLEQHEYVTKSYNYQLAACPVQIVKSATLLWGDFCLVDAAGREDGCLYVSFHYDLVVPHSPGPKS